MASITIYVPDQEPIAFDLDAIEQLTVGRGPDNDIVLDHVSLSGSHAVIQNAGGVFQLVDQGSTNGTFLNGEQISEGVLGHGSQIMFGSVEAVFADEAVAEAETEAADEGGLAESAGGGSGYGAHHAELSDVSNRPGNFKNLSPIKKVVKKDPFATVVTLLGVVAILAAAALIGLATTMSAT